LSRPPWSHRNKLAAKVRLRDCVPWTSVPRGRLPGRSLSLSAHQRLFSRIPQNAIMGEASKLTIPVTGSNPPVVTASRPNTLGMRWYTDGRELRTARRCFESHRSESLKFPFHSMMVRLPHVNRGSRCCPNSSPFARNACHNQCDSHFCSRANRTEGEKGLRREGGDEHATTSWPNSFDGPLTRS